MGLFGKLFGSKKLTLHDPDFGAMESLGVRKDIVHWSFKTRFLNTDIDVFIDGDTEKVSQGQKQILLSALESESQIKSESEKALKDKFGDAEIEFVSIEAHFEVNSISVSDRGFELTFEEKKDYYHFNVHFENNKEVGVSIDSWAKTWLRFSDLPAFGRTCDLNEHKDSVGIPKNNKLTATLVEACQRQASTRLDWCLINGPG